MDSAEHQNLVKIVRDVHRKLRKAYKESNGDFGTVWRSHLCSKKERTEYAEAVLKLATEKWTVEKDSRIYWCHATCQEYFFQGGLQRALQKEQRRTIKLSTGDFKNDNLVFSPVPLNIPEKLKLLDVGSCYNPFSVFEEIFAVPIDLTPATDDVFECDFMSLNIREVGQPELCLPAPPNAVTELPRTSFQVVVFSLILEYIPAASQRLMFCRKAGQLLIENGLLLIVTPDSKSQHHNAPMMKSWKLALKCLGFSLYKYEKLKHLHCMAYRKNHYADRDAPIIDDSTLSGLMYIPQDFQEFTDSLSDCADRNSDEDEEVKSSFCELPLEAVDL